MIPQIRTSPIQPFIPPFLITSAIGCFLWALFSVYQKQLRRIEGSGDAVTPLGLVQIEKLLGEIQHNYDELQMQSPAYTWRDEAWKFVNEGTLALSPELRSKIATFYGQVRSGKEGYNSFRPNSARRAATAPHGEAASKLAKEIIPELEALVSRVRKANC